VRMHEVMRLAHEFLQCFCLGNQANQNLLHQHLSMFLTAGVRMSTSSAPDSGPLTLCVSVTVCLLLCL